MQMRWSLPLDLAGLNIRGYVAPEGPILDSYDSASVLVTLARSGDGETLELGLEPMGGPLENTRLKFVHVLPATTYALRGQDGAVVASDRAGADGSLELTLPGVAGAVRLRLEVQR